MIFKQNLYFVLIHFHPLLILLYYNNRLSHILLTYFIFILLSHVSCILIYLTSVNLLSSLSLYSFQLKNTFYIYCKWSYNLVYIMINLSILVLINNYLSFFVVFNTIITFFNYCIVFLVFLLFVLLFTNQPSHNADLIIIIFAAYLFNLLFIFTNFFVVFILMEIISYLFFFIFVKYIMLRKKYKNYLVIYYAIIINFFSSFLFFMFGLLELWFFGLNKIDFSFFVGVTNFNLNDLLLFGLLIKIGLVPFFFYKFNFYKILPISLLFFYSFFYSFYMFFIFYLVSLNGSNILPLYTILLIFSYIFYTLRHVSIREFLFFSSMLSFVFLLFLIF